MLIIIIIIIIINTTNNIIRSLIGPARYLARSASRNRVFATGLLRVGSGAHM